jgi:hypothetical protein
MWTPYLPSLWGDILTTTTAPRERACGTTPARARVYSLAGGVAGLACCERACGLAIQHAGARYLYAARVEPARGTIDGPRESRRRRRGVAGNTAAAARHTAAASDRQQGAWAASSEQLRGRLAGLASCQCGQQCAARVSRCSGRQAGRPSRRRTLASRGGGTRTRPLRADPRRREGRPPEEARRVQQHTERDQGYGGRGRRPGRCIWAARGQRGYCHSCRSRWCTTQASRPGPASYLPLSLSTHAHICRSQTPARWMTRGTPTSR